MSKYVDLLDTDKPIAGQNFVCISFISPENIIKTKEIFMNEQFIKAFDLEISMRKFRQFLNFISFKYELDFNKINSDYEEYIKTEKANIGNINVIDEYKTFIENNEEELTRNFNREYKFQTNTRGIKVRGCFDTQEEAEMRCKQLRDVDPNHDIYVGPVGTWMPWEPNAYKTGKVEHLEKELNNLMNLKIHNDKKAKEYFDQRVYESKKNAIEENKKLSKKTGNVLSQDIDENGNLFSINNIKKGVDLRNEYSNLSKE